MTNESNTSESNTNEPSSSAPFGSAPFISAMFPLGSVLLPYGPLPLHIFEPRYQQLLNEALEGDRTFGVVLISRGSEVGGGEQRNPIGTLAYIDEHSRFDDGRAAVIARGIGRIEVVDWLPDDPYPRATIRHLPEVEPGAGYEPRLDEVRSAFVELLATAVKVGRLDALPEIGWTQDRLPATWQLAEMAGISQHDRQSILAEDDPVARLDLIGVLIADAHTDLRLLTNLD